MGTGHEAGKRFKLEENTFYSGHAYIIIIITIIMMMMMIIIIIIIIMSVFLERLSM